MVYMLPWSWSLFVSNKGLLPENGLRVTQRELNVQCGIVWRKVWEVETFLECKIDENWKKGKEFMGSTSQCIYRIMQGFLAQGILLCMVFVHGFWPIVILVFFGPFWREWGYVTINAQLLCIYGGRNNNVLDHFWWNLIVKVKMKGIMVGLWCIIMVWTIESYVDNFWC